MLRTLSRQLRHVRTEQPLDDLGVLLRINPSPGLAAAGQELGEPRLHQNIWIRIAESRDLRADVIASLETAPFRR